MFLLNGEFHGKSKPVFSSDKPAHSITVFGKITPMVKRIGMTGGIGSGKSLVEGFLRELNVPVIDADAIVHQLLAEDEALKTAIRNHFGPQVFTPTGAGDRAALGQRVFANPTDRQLLESWIHPKVRASIDAFFQQHDAEPLAVAVIPLLYESGLQSRYDEIWLVVADEGQQLARLTEKRGLSETDARQRMAAQMPLSEKRQHHPIEIDNTQAPEETRCLVQALVAKSRPLPNC
jgi:dephospho-CoA kinase